MCIVIYNISIYRIKIYQQPNIKNFSLILKKYHTQTSYKNIYNIGLNRM